MTKIITPDAVLPQWPGLQAAMDDVRTHGIITGKEKMIIVAPDGTQKYTYFGDEHQVECLPLGDFSGCMAVHDHPVGCELSIMDLGFATFHKVAGIMAVMPDGSWSLAKGLTCRVPSWSEMFLFNQMGIPGDGPFFDALRIGSRAFHCAASYEQGAQRGNRALLTYLNDRGYLDSYQLHLEAKGKAAFSGLEGLAL